MSIINLRQAPGSPSFPYPERNDEFPRGRPLSNIEVDANFQQLNHTKLDQDGSVIAESLSIGTPGSFVDITFDPNANTLTFSKAGGGSLTLVATSISATALTELIVAGKTVLLGGVDPYDPYGIDSIYNYISAGGGGIRLGEYNPSRGYVDFLFNSSLGAWVGGAGDNSEVSFAADDFKILDSLGTTVIETLRDAHEQLDQINWYLGTNGGNPSSGPVEADWVVPGTPGPITYATTNSVDDGTSLKAAIEALDAEDIPSIRDFVGQASVGDHDPDYTLSGANLGVGVVDNDSLFTAIDKINSAMLYVTHKVESKTTAFTAVSGRMYLVTPPPGNSVVVTLPSINRGIVTVRLEDDTNSRKILVQGGSDNLIESLNPTDVIEIDVKYQSIQFIWDSTLSKWRII